MKRLLRLLVCSSILAVPVNTGATASAGGWAVSTLDEVPAPAPGETVTVGFTIRQHGVTPVNVDDVAVEVTGPSDAIEVFAARQDGAVGHYLADVVFGNVGDIGAYTWRVRQGWFAAHELGTIDISSGGASNSTSTSTQFLRFGLPALAIALAGYAASDAMRHRTVCFKRTVASNGADRTGG